MLKILAVIIAAVGLTSCVPREPDEPDEEMRKRFPEEAAVILQDDAGNKYSAQHWSGDQYKLRRVQP